VALVPAGKVESLAHKIQEAVRDWVKKQAHAALAELLDAADMKGAARKLLELCESDVADVAVQMEKAGFSSFAYAARQLVRQFAGFPEVHWAIVPWHVAGEASLDDSRLKKLLVRLGADSAYLDPALDGLLRREITVEGYQFFRPNPGTAYPGIYEALERLHATAKAARPFDNEAERGYRCTLCGEREWLTDDPDLLGKPSGERKEKSLWTAVAENKPTLAKEGEHLCGVCALKRAWPRLFVKEIANAVPELGRLDRFVLSTRAVAMSTSIWRWLERKARGVEETPEEATKRLQAENRLRLRIQQAKELRGASLPRRLFGRLRRENQDVDFFKALPALVDSAEIADEAAQIAADIDAFLGAKSETYYALVLMDGDRMGAWLSGEEGRQKMEKRFHTKTLAALRREGEFQQYLEAMRPVSPARHQAISTALNGFALHLARVLVEDLFMGKLIYAGGDDLMAMVAVHDLPGLMLALRCAYSGVLPEGVEEDAFWQRVTGESQERLRISNGFAVLTDRHDGRNVTRMFRLMGDGATASMGAVIAHHQAPLARVLADLREAEKRAKGEGGRDAFCLTLTKRAGGATNLVGKWRLDAGMDGDMGLLLELRDLIARQVSRRAAYLLAESLRDLPASGDALAAALAYRFGRQGTTGYLDPVQLARRLARAADGRPANRGEPEWPGPNRWLRDLLLSAEFLAREGRIGNGKEDD
jgi:CRISPR-associated protein Cmr2